MTESKNSSLDPGDDAPDLSSPEWQAKAEKALAARKGGRPFKAAHERKVTTTIRLDPVTLERFRALGPGWQTKINEVLRDWVAARHG